MFLWFPNHAWFPNHRFGFGRKPQPDFGRSSFAARQLADHDIVVAYQFDNFTNVGTSVAHGFA